MRTNAQAFDRRLTFACPAWLADALAAKAREDMTSINSILRRACTELVAKESKTRLSSAGGVA